MSLSNASSPTGIWRGLAPVVSFSATIFVSAGLLFFVQPLFTKLVLPRIGGTPAVWTTAMLFFQLTLILGYLYAHMLTRWLTLRWQLAVHMALWAIALTFLPLAVTRGLEFDTSQSIALQTLLLFAAGVGAPFAVLSANAPLLQAWYTKSGGPSADDPYFLYAASNVGSLLALLAFPLLADPFLGASDTSLLWSVGFVVFGFLLLTSGLVALRGASSMQSIVPPRAPSRNPSVRNIATWVFIAFIPSSLMLSTTTKLSIDLGAIPLIWVVPLATYILTFILAFSNWKRLTLEGLKVPTLVALAIVVALLSKVAPSHQSPAVMLVYIPILFVVSLFAHRMLYELRPPAEQLTVFYLALSVGGACGGLFNSIIAPIAFTHEIEFALTIMLAAGLFLLQGQKFSARHILVGLLASIPLLLATGALTTASVLGEGPTAVLAAIALLSAILLAFRNAPTRLATALCVVVLPTLTPQTSMLYSDRSFFGTHAVYNTDGFRVYKNGTTIHGWQRQSSFGERPVALSYYHPDGPMAKVLTSEYGRNSGSIGIVGLGTGALACYRRPHQTWVFFEIDETVKHIAQNPELFTYLSECAPNSEIQLGDARIVLDKQSSVFDILVLDAYSSDAIPLHLITQEAIQIYLDRLRDDGTLVFHISNKYYDLSPQLARAADTLGLHAAFKLDEVTEEAEAKGAATTRVVILSRNKGRISDLTGDGNWQTLTSDGRAPWTDDKANLLSALKILN